MSAVLIGAAAIAASACVAAGKLVVDGAQLAYKGLTWLSDEGVRALDRLDRELSQPLDQVTTNQARREFDQKFERVRTAAARTPALRHHADAAAAILTLRKSALGRFLSDQDAAAVHQARLSTGRLAQILAQAGQRMTTASADYLVGAVAEAAREAGFKAGLDRRREGARETLVLKNDSGQAVVAQVKRSDRGSDITIDLTGFADGSCHSVMDDLVRRLSARGVRLFDERRRSHYRREGVLLVPAAPVVDRPTTRRAEQKNELRRRRRAQAGTGQRQGS